MEDRDLISRSLSGDQEAFSRLMQKHYSYLYALAKSYLHQPELTEDVLQESFTAMFQKLNSLKNPNKFGSWAYTIVYRECMHMLKKMKKEPSWIADVSLADPDSDNKRAAAGEGNLAYADEQFSRFLQRDLLEKGISRLPLKYRGAIIAYFFTDQNYAETATQLGISYKAAEKRIHRAVKMLEKIIKKDYRD